LIIFLLSQPRKWNIQVLSFFSEDGVVNSSLQGQANWICGFFLESASAHLQVISNFILEHAEKSGPNLAKSKKTKNRVTFTFHFMSKGESNIWEEEYQNFENRFRERSKEVSSKTPSLDYIAFGGQVPTRKSTK